MEDLVTAVANINPLTGLFHRLKVGTEPSYKSESSDSVARKPLDAFLKAFYTNAISLV